MSCAEMTSKVGVTHKISHVLTRAVYLAPPYTQSWIRPWGHAMRDHQTGLGTCGRSQSGFKAHSIPVTFLCPDQPGTVIRVNRYYVP